jgi:hypothetical protein
MYTHFDYLKVKSILEMARILYARVPELGPILTFEHGDGQESFYDEVTGGEKPSTDCSLIGASVSSIEKEDEKFAASFTMYESYCEYGSAYGNDRIKTTDYKEALHYFINALEKYKENFYPE